MLRRNLIYTFSGEAVSKTLILVVFIYLAKILGPLDYGYFNLALTFYLMGRTISHNSLDMHGVRLLSPLTERVEINRVLSNVNAVRLIFALVISLVAVTAALVLYRDFRVRWICIGFSICFIASTFLSEWFFNGLQRMFYSAMSQVGIWGAFLICVFLLPEKSIYLYLPLAFFSSIILVAVVMNLFILRLAGKFRYNFNFKQMKSLFVDTGYINLVNIFGYLINSIGIFTLSLSSNPTDLGYYSVALQICSMFILAGSLIYRVTLPHLNSIYQVSESDFSRKMIFTTKYLGFGAVLVVFYLTSYSKVVLVGLLGDKYLDVVPIITMLGSIVFFGYLMMGFFQGLFIMGRDKLLMHIYLFQLVLTTVLTVTCFKFFGPYGIPLSLVVSYFVGFIVFAVSFYKVNRFDYSAILKETVLGAVLIYITYSFFNGDIPVVFAVIFPLVYLVLCIVLNVVNLTDIRTMLRAGVLAN